MMLCHEPSRQENKLGPEDKSKEEVELKNLYTIGRGLSSAVMAFMRHSRPGMLRSQFFSAVSDGEVPSGSQEHGPADVHAPGPAPRGQRRWDTCLQFGSCQAIP